jgi:hypothetical protein
MDSRYFHGGGYAIVSTHADGGLCKIRGILFGILQLHRLVERSRSSTASVSRESQWNVPVPAALIDALASYLYLVFKVILSSLRILLVETWHWLSPDNTGGPRSLLAWLAISD